jgi:GntR family transcriptional regulator
MYDIDVLFDVIHDMGASISRRRPLSRVMGDRFRTLLQQGILQPGTQLPPEPEMALALGISRMTLRASLNLLEREGTVVRRQGKGTFLTNQPLLPNRLDLNLGVAENIRSMGMEPGIKDICIDLISADEQWAGHLDVPEGTALVDIHRTRTADGRPVVATRDLFPQTFLDEGRQRLSLQGFSDLLRQEMSLYAIMEDRLGLTLDYGVARIRPATVVAPLAQQLNVVEGSLLMYVEQIDYDDAGTPLLLSYEYHVPEVYEFTVYRKR